MSDAHIIIAGQSNALGFGNTGPAPYVPTARVQIWADTNGDGVGDAWNYMLPGHNTGTPTNPTVWGPEVEIANRWLADHSDGFLWIVKDTKGSTGLAADAGALDWSPQSHGEMFDLTTSAVNASIQNLIGNAHAFDHFDALMWMQGEQDALDPLKAQAYGANLNAFDAAARAAWHVSDVVVGRITDAAVMPYSSDVRVAEWADDQGDAAMTSFKTIGFGMQADGLHYSAAGHVQLGDGFYGGWLSFA